jgi:hypothetical protein
MNRRTRIPAAPRGPTGTSHARRCASHEGAPQRARVPPVDYGDGPITLDDNPKR